MSERNGRSPLLEVENLVTRFPVPRGLVGALAGRPKLAVRAVDGVSFSLRTGEMLALVGESGSGKTTTAQTILRLVEPESGSDPLPGRGHLGRLRARDARAAPPRPAHLPGPVRVARPALPRARRRSRSRCSSTARAAAAPSASSACATRSTRAGLTPPELFLDRYPHELSGGQRQRVAIAASLVLDPAAARRRRAGLDARRLRPRRDPRAPRRAPTASGLGILMITHDLSTAAHFADRIAVMYLGRIVEEGPAREVVAQPEAPVHEGAHLGRAAARSARVDASRRSSQGETPNPIADPPGCRFNPRCPIAIAECRTTDPELRVPAGARAGHLAACIRA